MPFLHESPLPLAHIVLPVSFFDSNFSHDHLLRSVNIANGHKLLCVFQLLEVLYSHTKWAHANYLAVGSNFSWILLSCFFSLLHLPQVSMLCPISLWKTLSFHRFLISLLPCDLSSLMSSRKFWFVYPAFYVAVVEMGNNILFSIIHPK